MFFKIWSIDHGWFKVELGHTFLLFVSDYLGCDAPALFLEAVCDLLEGKAEVRWLCWQDEPGASILRLERFQDELRVEVYGADRDAMGLEQRGDAFPQREFDRLKKVMEAGRCQR